jgi:hypothetical protein
VTVEWCPPRPPDGGCTGAVRRAGVGGERIQRRSRSWGSWAVLRRLSVVLHCSSVVMSRSQCSVLEVLRCMLYAGWSRTVSAACGCCYLVCPVFGVESGVSIVRPVFGVESGVSLLFAGTLYDDSVVCCRLMLSIPSPSFRDFILIILSNLIIVLTKNSKM